MSLMYAKESIVLSALKDIEENQKHMQDVNLQSSNVWKAKSLQQTMSNTQRSRIRGQALSQQFAA